MEFKEAYQNLREGKKIRRKAWDESIYLIMEIMDDIKCYRQEAVPFYVNLNILASDDWLVVGDEDKQRTFVDILEFLQQGKRARLIEWPKDCFIESTKDLKTIFMRRICAYEFSPQFECFMTNDWMILE